MTIILFHTVYFIALYFITRLKHEIYTTKDRIFKIETSFPGNFEFDLSNSAILNLFSFFDSCHNRSPKMENSESSEAVEVRLSDVCRSCLIKTDNMTNFFPKNDATSDIIAMLSSVGNIEVRCQSNVNINKNIIFS
jgi:hypothetical protein